MRARRGQLAALVALVAAACAGGSGGDRAPVSPRGVLVIEPPRVYVGELVDVEVAVVTPADHGVLPVALPEEVPGFWLLDARELPPRDDGARRIHRTRVRIRAREAGGHRWPDLVATAVAPSGDRIPVPIPGREVEVVSNRELVAHRSGPFDLRAPPGGPGAPLRAALLGGALGAGGVLAAMGIRRLHRRRRALESAAAAEVEADVEAPASFARVRAALDGAAQRASLAPREAAGAAVVALRGYFGERYRLDLSASTVEELEVREAPIPWRSTWPEFLEILRALDGIRFPPRPGPEAATRLAETLERARALVERTAPGGPRP